MIKAAFLLGLGLVLAAARAAADLAPEVSAPSPAVSLDPVQRWEVDFATGVLWHFTGSATPLDYVIQPQIVTVKSPDMLSGALDGGNLVLRSRYSLLVEPIVQGPEHHYFGLTAGACLEWWDRARTRCLFFSSGGGVGELDSHGQTIAGAQGQEFNLTWFAYCGARLRLREHLSAGFGLYFQHLSNGHLDKVDPGLNALGPLASLGWDF